MHHILLKYALSEFKDDHQKLLNLLSCLNRAAEVSPLIDNLVKSGKFELLQEICETIYEKRERVLKSVDKFIE